MIGRKSLWLANYKHAGTERVQVIMAPADARPAAVREWAAQNLGELLDIGGIEGTELEWEKALKEKPL